GARGAEQQRELSGTGGVSAGDALQSQAARAEAAGGDQPSARYDEPRRARQPGGPRGSVDQVKGIHHARDGESQMLKFPIFMDAQSTTPVDPRVAEPIIPYFTHNF